MATPFKHPLARQARVWSAVTHKGKASRVLVVITTLELHPDSKKFKKDKVARLADEAAKWISENTGEATHFMLVNRPKDWDDSQELLREDSAPKPSSKGDGPSSAVRS